MGLRSGRAAEQTPSGVPDQNAAVVAEGLSKRYPRKKVTLFPPTVNIFERGWFGRRIPGVGGIQAGQLWGGAGFADEVLSALEARALWARYGL